MYYEDLNDHPMAIFATIENYVSPAERRWLHWIESAEELIGHSLDGDQNKQGFSYDWAYAAWESGDSPLQHINEIARNPVYWTANH